MKTIKYLLTGALAAMLSLNFSSCLDLEERTYTFIDPNTFYKTESEVDAALNGVYNRFRNMYTANSQLYLAQLELYTEQGWPTYNKNNMETLNKWYDCQNPSSGEPVSKIWANAYACINRANIVLERHKGVTMPDESHNRIEGQALFLRAYSYWHLIRLFGGVPLVTTYTKSPEGLEVPRNTIDECYTQIIKDLEDAAERLPVKGTAGYDVWRASKGACQALLGEVYLYRATINGGTPNTEYLTKARDYSKAVIEDGDYDLMPVFTDQYYWFNANAKNNIESIFELQFAPLSGQSNDMHIRFGLGRTFKAYMGCYQYARMGVSGYLYKEMLNNGDSRANAFLTYFEDNDNVAHAYDIATYSWTNPGTSTSNDRNVQHMCVFNCKYFDNRTDADLQKPNANFPMLRYAEVLLNYAEAANLLSAGQGVTELTKVLDRAYGPGSAYAASLDLTTQAGIDEAIFQQRRYEFVGEGKVFFDELRRDVLGDYASAKCIQGKLDGISYFDADDVLFKAGRDFLFQIPQGDLDSSNGAIVQNPVVATK